MIKPTECSSCKYRLRSNEHNSPLDRNCCGCWICRFGRAIQAWTSKRTIIRAHLWSESRAMIASLIVAFLLSAFHTYRTWSRSRLMHHRSAPGATKKTFMMVMKKKKVSVDCFCDDQKDSSAFQLL